MEGAQINPQLIQLLSGKEVTEIPESPPKSLLPGKYAELVSRNGKKIQRYFEENELALTCKNCGREGKYDVGLIVVNDDPEKLDEEPGSIIQTTGYFRCRHCNAALLFDYILVSPVILIPLNGPTNEYCY